MQRCISWYGVLSLPHMDSVVTRHGDKERTQASKQQDLWSGTQRSITQPVWSEWSTFSGSFDNKLVAGITSVSYQADSELIWPVYHVLLHYYKIWSLMIHVMFTDDTIENWYIHIHISAWFVLPAIRIIKEGRSNYFWIQYFILLMILFSYIIFLAIYFT